MGNQVPGLLGPKTRTGGITYGEEKVRLRHCSTALVGDTSNLGSGDIQGNTEGVTLQMLLIAKRESSCFSGFQSLCFLRYVLIGPPSVYNPPALLYFPSSNPEIISLSLRLPLCRNPFHRSHTDEPCQNLRKGPGSITLFNPRWIPRRLVLPEISSAQYPTVR